MVFKSFVELLYPRLCLVCGDRLIDQEELVCLSCLHHIPRTRFHLEEDNPVAQLFYGRVHLEHATAFFYFRKGSRYQKILHHLKYKGLKELGELMGRQLGLDLLQSPHFSKVDAICPVPLHPKKEQKRGYNQSWWIAKGLAEQIQKPMADNHLERIAFSSTQTRKSRFERWENVEGIFKVKNPEELSGKHILLVDDVVTTGSTLEACASAMLSDDTVKVSIATLGVA